MVAKPSLSLAMPRASRPALPMAITSSTNRKPTRFISKSARVQRANADIIRMPTSFLNETDMAYDFYTGRANPIQRSRELMDFRNFRIETDADGVALVTWDAPGRSMNVIDMTTIEELASVVEQVASDTAIKGAVVTSA